MFIDYLTVDTNYIWLIRDGRQCIVVDPTEGGIVEQYLERHNLDLVAIVLTHSHLDHIAGCPILLSNRELPVYGTSDIQYVNRPVGDGDVFYELSQCFRVMDTPGHTKFDVTYIMNDQHIFCGDLIFSVGCGKVFGTYEDMYQSLCMIKQLDDEMLIYPGHEYTEQNCRFAMVVDPTNEVLLKRYDNVRKKLVGLSPVTIGTEKEMNPFLRCDQCVIKHSVERFSGSVRDDFDVFCRLRRWKDSF